MSEWRSIETAPSRIEFRCLLAHEHSVVTGYWDGRGWTNERSRFGSHFPATHWMPLPDPPEMTESKDTIKDRAIHWLISGDTGLSSVAILRHMIGADGDKKSYPRDPSDLGRCLRLLEHFPEWGERISEMSEHGPEWAGLVSRWQSIRSTMIREVGINWSHGDRAPETYRAMQSAIADGRDSRQGRTL